MRPNNPVAVMPRVYQLMNGLPWGWCRINEVLEIVAELSERQQLNYSPSAVQLVRDFAALAPWNKKTSPRDEPKKLFRYSTNGTDLHAAEVPRGYRPTHAVLQLKLPAHFTQTFYVREDWTKATLLTLRHSAVSVIDWGESNLVAFPPESRREPHLIHGRVDVGTHTVLLPNV